MIPDALAAIMLADDQIEKARVSAKEADGETRAEVRRYLMQLEHVCHLAAEELA